jgi:predicted permease
VGPWFVHICQHGRKRGGLVGSTVVRLPLELFPCLTAGVLLGMAFPWLPVVLAPALVRWGIPISLAGLLLRSPLSFTLIKVGALGLLVPLLTLAVLALPPMRRCLHSRVLLLGASMGNTGYWGLPVALALLPAQAWATIVAYDMAGSLITWSVGPLVLRGIQGSWRKLLAVLVASPALQGFALSLVIGQTPWRVAVGQVLWWPARLVFWLALTLVGMRLGLTLKERNLAFSAGVPWALAVKLLVVPAMVWLLAGALGLSPLDRKALVLQGAAPTALAVLLLAEAEREDVPLASTLLLASTFAAMVSVPVWWRLIH